jgi:hypothetical protein
MSKATTKMLKDLLERVESDDVLITDFRVTNEVEKVPTINLDGKVSGTQEVFSGNQIYSIKAVEVTKAPEPSEEAVARFKRTAAWLREQALNLADQTEDKDNG